MKKKIFKIILCVILCWAIFVAMEGVRLIGSTDPGKYPLLYIGGTQVGDKCAEYHSLGFTLDYHLGLGDMFSSGEFRLLGITIASWGKTEPDQEPVIDPSQYAGFLMEYKRDDMYFTCVFDKNEINYFNSLVLNLSASQPNPDSWIFKFTFSSSLSDTKKTPPNPKEVIPSNATIKELLIFEEYFQIDGNTYAGTPKLVQSLIGRFASNLPA